MSRSAAKRGLEQIEVRDAVREGDGVAADIESRGSHRVELATQRGERLPQALSRLLFEPVAPQYRRQTVAGDTTARRCRDDREHTHRLSAGPDRRGLSVQANIERPQKT
jgi:hypothetical protein